MLNEVHRTIEARDQRFVLLRSSARRFKAAGTNLLAGRAVQKTMYPFVPGELGTDFDLDAVLTHGSIQPLQRRLGTMAQARGRMLRFARNTLPGSNRSLTFTSRSKFAP